MASAKSEEIDKMKKEDIQTLIRYYRDNPMLSNTADPQYRNKELKTKLKANLLKQFGNKYSMDVLDKKFHSLRTSMRREVKREAEESTEEPPTKKTNKKPWPYFEVMSFMKDEVLQGQCISVFVGVYRLQHSTIRNYLKFTL